MSRILYILGLVLVFFSIIELLPLIIDLIFESDNWGVFFVCSFFTFFIGISLILAGSSKTERLTTRDAYILTALIWLVVPIIGSVPFIFSVDNITLVDSFFETVSGLTTTGSTIFRDLETLQPGLLFWRSILQWTGGVGIIIMSIAIFPLLKVGGMQLMKTESSGWSDKALPRTSEIAIAITIIYFVLTLACIIIYLICGMSFFDAINHSMTTISTGGFSTHNESFAYFNSVAINFSAIVFMILGALPFVLYVKMMRKNISVLYSNNQVKFFIKFCLCIIITLTFWFWVTTNQDLLDAFVFASFNAVSIITTTGFTSSEFSFWGSASLFVLILAFSGGCSGSAAGSIKAFRYQLMIRFLGTQFNKLLHPHGVFLVRYGGQGVAPDIIFSVTAFLTLYLLSWAVLSSLVSFSGLDFQTSISAAAAALTNVGPAVGINNHYSDFNDINKILLSFGMLIGRLELFIVFVFLVPSFWKEN